jgi:inosose dehydratase
MTFQTRRNFLKTTSLFAAGAACSTLPGNAHAAEAGRLKLGIQLYSLRGYSRDEALQHASDEEIAATKKKVADLGMSISAHGVNRLTKDAAKNRQIFEFAKKLGAASITADPDLDSFDSLDDLVKEFDIRVAIHNHGPRHRYNKAIDVLRVIEGRDKRIGACADLGHYIRSGQNAPEVIRWLKGRLYGIHLKDFAEMKDKTEGVILGKGHLNLEAVFFELQSAGFPSNGALSLEYEENKDNPLADIRECVTVAKAAMKTVAKSR